jgi:hypothetical protein
VRLLLILVHGCRRFVENLDGVQQICGARLASLILLISIIFFFKITAEEYLSSLKREVLSNDHTKELQCLSMRRHGICRD